MKVKSNDIVASGNWCNTSGIVYGTNVCFRCGKKMQEYQRYRVAVYVADQLRLYGATFERSYRIYHLRCPDA